MICLLRDVSFHFQVENPTHWTIIQIIFQSNCTSLKPISNQFNSVNSLHLQSSSGAVPVQFNQIEYDLQSNSGAIQWDKIRFTEQFQF